MKSIIYLLSIILSMTSTISSTTVVSSLTWIHLAYLLYERLIKTCYYGATYWNHEVLVQALYKGIDSSHTSSLMTHSPIKRVINHSGQRTNDSKHFYIIHLSSELSFSSSLNMQLLHKWRQVQVFYKRHMDPGRLPHTCCMRCMHLDDCTPYALLTMWGMLYLAHMVASSSSLRDKTVHHN